MKIIQYFRRSGVDTILLIVSIASAIKVYPSHNLAAAVLSVFALYILGTIFRMGQATDLINDYVWDKQVRMELHLSPVPGEYYKTKKTTFAKIVDIIWVLGFITIIVGFLVL